MPDDDRDETFSQLAEALTATKMRPAALSAAKAFIRALLSGDGGTLVIQAPYGKNRDLAEIGFRSESWVRLLA